MAEQKKAKYFCESCGAEVAAKAKFCPKCGKFFSSVRCPQCGKLGNVNDFKNGCPQCHYAMSHEELYGTDDDEVTLDGRKHRLSAKNKRKIKAAFREHEKKTESGDVPVWLFVTAIVLLIIISAMIFYRCQ